MTSKKPRDPSPAAKHKLEGERIIKSICRAAHEDTGAPWSQGEVLWPADQQRIIDRAKAWVKEEKRLNA